MYIYFIIIFSMCLVWSIDSLIRKIRFGDKWDIILESISVGINLGMLIVWVIMSGVQK